jgi:signal transduction histidine kinase
MVSGASTTAALHNKNMSMLAEQLHHEINTPLTVVKTLCDKVLSEIKDSAICGLEEKRSPCNNCEMPKKYQKLRGYKKIIDDNIRQAYVVIERMAEVKQVRYSNGNKTLYDITKATFDIMGVYNRANYVYTIDNRLREYIVDHNSGIKNHEVMNILLNHIKNSLEANASDIRVILHSIAEHRMSSYDSHIMSAIMYADKYLPNLLSDITILMLDKMISKSGKERKSIARVLLIDNGKGIPEQFAHNIFNLNWSSKKKNGIVRGAGLYLNRAILRTAGGDVDVLESSSRGTTFILSIPVIKK